MSDIIETCQPMVLLRNGTIDVMKQSALQLLDCILGLDLGSIVYSVRLSHLFQALLV
jgi:hypothetical protein